VGDVGSGVQAPHHRIEDGGSMVVMARPRGSARRWGPTGRVDASTRKDRRRLSRLSLARGMERRPGRDSWDWSSEAGKQQATASQRGDEDETSSGAGGDGLGLAERMMHSYRPQIRTVRTQTGVDVARRMDAS
jgi:hypothetical protein